MAHIQFFETFGLNSSVRIFFFLSIFIIDLICTVCVFLVFQEEQSGVQV